MGTSAAAKMRAYRERQASGRKVLKVNVDFDRLADALVADGFLKHNWHSENRDLVECAAEKVLELYITDCENRLGRVLTRD